MAYTALYERISNDDDLPGESLSILNQREYLENYAVTHDHIPFRHFTDDGFTGTNFRRPGFQHMLNEIEMGKVDTVIVKDLSRFGRNYREAGFYLEKVFPTYGIRFIAVLNQVDTKENEDNFSLPLFNMINDWYSKDLSRRTKASFKQMAKNAHRFTGISIYGYLCDPKNRDRWIIDPIAAETMRKIFRYSLEGDLMPAIAAKLNEENILRPNDYYLIRNWSSQHSWRHQMSHEWSDKSIQNMIHNEEYAGVKILRKSIDPVRYLNDHEPIISPSNWKILQKRLSVYEVKQFPAFDNIRNFPAVFYCNHCHQRLSHGPMHSKPAIWCFNPRCTVPQPLLYISQAEIVLRFLQDTLYRCLPDPSSLLTELNIQKRKNILRSNRVAKEYTVLLKNRLEEIFQYMLVLYETSDLPKELLSTLLDAYREEKELITKELKRFQNPKVYTPITAQNLKDIFLQCPHAFIDRIEVTSKSHASRSQYILIHLSSNIPQPPLRTIPFNYDLHIHFLPGTKDLSQTIKSLLQDDLIL